MDRNIRSMAIALAAWTAAGCQPTTPPPAPPAAAAPPVVAVVPATAAAGPVASNSKAEIAARLAAQQAASIDAMLAAKEGNDRGVTVVEPAHVDAAPPPIDAAPRPAPIAATPAPPPAANPQLRPIPPLDGASPVAAPAAPAVTLPPNPPPLPADALPRQMPVAPPPRGEDSLVQSLMRRAAEVPHDLAAQLDAQLSQFAADTPVPTPEALAGLSVEDRNVLEGVLNGLSNFRTAIRNDGNLLIGDKIRPLLDMADRLRGQADLRVVNFAICRAAPGFGIYDPIVPSTLVRNSKFPLFYYEIENFNPRLNEKNMYVTTLRQDMVLYDKNGKPVWTSTPLTFADSCRNRRHDFFFAGPLKLAMGMPAGAYTLKVTLTDPAAQRVGEKSLVVTFVDPPSAPGAAVPPRSVMSPVGPPVAPPVVQPLFDR